MFEPPNKALQTGKDNLSEKPRQIAFAAELNRCADGAELTAAPKESANPASITRASRANTERSQRT
jgi:hypothetical protein